MSPASRQSKRETLSDQALRDSSREAEWQWYRLAERMGAVDRDILAPSLRRLAVEHFAFPVVEDFGIRWCRRHAGKEKISTRLWSGRRQ